MANNSPTIVAASLSDDQLKTSINNLVAHVDEAMKKMVQSTNNAVGEMEAKLKSLGNLKIDSGGSADGGASKRTKTQNAETEAVKKNVAARDKQIKKNQEVKMSFDQMQTALEKATRLPSEMRMPDMAKSARESFQAFYKGFNEQARKLDSLIKAEDNRLASAGLGRFSSETQAQLAKVDASIDQTRWKINFLYQEEKRLNQEALRQKVSSVGFEQAWLKKDETKSARVREGERLIELEKERQRIIASDPTVQQLDRNIEQTRAKIQQLLADEKRLHSESLKTTVGSSELERLWNQKYQVRDQRIAEQEKLIQLEKERQNLVAVDPIRTQLANVDELRAKHEKVLGVMRDETTTNNSIISKQQQQNAELEKQLTTIKNIDNTNKARSAFKSVTGMDANNEAQIRAKLDALIELKKKVAGTPLLSKSNMNMLDWMIGDLNKKVSSLGETQKNVSNQSKQTLDELNAYIRQNIQREQERRDAIRQTGLAARETADQLIRSAHEQASVHGNSPITGIKELTVAVEQMRQAYFDMSASEKASPIGLALEADIKRANDAIVVIKKYNQSLLGLQQNNANNITNASTLNSLRESLKNLTAQYNKLTVAELNAGKGDAIIQHFQDTTRAAQILQRTLNRPVSLKAALAGDERTLDDIAYKMQRLRAYKQGIDLTKPNAENEIKQVDEALARLQKDADKWMSKSQEMVKNNTALGRSWNYMKNRLAFYFTVGASTQFVKNLIEVRSQYEMNERALGILINSAERGTQIFNELSQMALVSPYTLIELSSAAKQLTAYDVAARDVVDTTRRLADMAAAVGIPIERLTYALGQIKAYGYLNSRDARMFANAGIPLVKQLSDYYTELEGRLVSTADVYDRIKKKAIDYNEVMEVINKMTDQGSKFFDFQAKMADTLKVRLANLTLAWNNMLNDMGKQSQGVLTWGIGALRDLFLQWKQLNNLIENAALAVGVRTLLVVIRAATIGLGSFGKAMTWNAILGKKLGGVVVGLAKSFGTLFSSRLTWFALLAIAAVEATQAIFGVNEAQKALNESIHNSAKDNYDNISKFLEQYQEVRDSLYAANTKGVHRVFADNLGKTVTADKDNYLVPETQIKDIDQNEAKKAWEAVREQIELTVTSSDKYIGNLLSISNMSERVRQGFNLLDDVQVVNAALKELDDDTISVSKDLSAWWNAWQAPDGLIGNLKDYQETLNDIIAEYGTLESFRENTFLGGKGSDDLNDYETALERFRDDLQKTTDSIINFIELKGWSGDESKINQVFEQITQKLVLDNQLDPQKAFTLQTEVEEARSKAAKEALLQRINDERAALKISHDDSVREALAADEKRYKNWDETNGRSKVEWERFTKWLKEQHISETTAMFRNMDAKDIKSLNFQEGNHAEWVTRMVTQYAKEHKMSYDEAFKYLKSWVKSANQWSVFIPLIISTEDKKSVYDQLGEYDKAVDEADAQIERLTKRIGELNAKKKKSKEETQELANAEQELADAQKAKADAESKGGHGKKEKKDERAANKAAKQAESELAKALKEELSTIDKVRSIYKDLTKEGMSHAYAVERATRGWDETVNAINRVLQKNGLQKLDLSKFVGIENPRELVNMLQSQLNTLLKRGAKPADIKELQTKIQTLNIDAEKYDLTKITKGLNNELGKLKDEYELAVELDTSPELGNMFTQMFGLDTNDFPRTIGDYMNRVQQEFDKARMKLNLGTSLNVFKANTEQWYDWGKAVGYSEEQVDDFKKSFDGSVGVAKKWVQDVVKQTQDLQYKLADNNGKIAIEEKKLAALRQSLAQETNDKQKALLELQIQDQQNAINKLKEEILQLLPTYNRLFGEVAEHSAAMTRKLARDYKNMLVDAQKRGKNPDGTYTIIDPVNGKSASITEERLGKEIKSANKELGKTDNIFKKIKESFKKGEDGIIDWVGGIENIGEAIGQVGDLVDTIGNVYDMFGNPNEYDATSEALHDIATTMQGVNTAAKGIGQIASGDYIGGAMSVISGLSSAISTWFDNGDKEILQQIKESERAVKRLELAYIDLEHAINNAYGTATVGAQQAAIANKELQLVELKRQLRLEQSRDSKDKDEDRIIELRKQIKELEYDIKDATDAIVNDLLGISSVGDALDNLMGNIIESFRQGSYKFKEIMKDWKTSINDMIAEMVKKMYVSELLQPWFEKQWGKIQEDINGRISKLSGEEIIGRNIEGKEYSAKELLAIYQETLEELESGGGFKAYENIFKDEWEEVSREQYIENLKKAIELLQSQINEASATTPEDIKKYAELLKTGSPIVEENLKGIEDFLRELGLLNDKKTTTMSALQQGISQISESTAESLEAYMNGVSQQVYYHSSLLEQIRDSVVGLDFDVSLGVQSQMLLQLQNSYQTQQAIQQILEGVLVPSGRAFAVELMS